MKILLIGGNGNISWHCTQKLLELGHDVYELHRGVTYATRRDIHAGAKIIHADIRNEKETFQVLAGAEFDAVCDFICYDAVQAQHAVNMFRDKTKQYLVISSDVVYERNISNIPFTEKSKLKNKECASAYIRGKLEMEEVLWKAYQDFGFPVTIVRPGYTYDTILPVSIGHNCWSAIDKILKGYPLLIAGDGNSIWNMTNSRDFAEAFVCLAGRRDCIGEAYDIASDEWITWNDASEILLQALGVEKNRVFHVPYERALHIPEFQPDDMSYDRMWHNFRTNQKIKETVDGFRAKISLEAGIRMSLAWLQEKEVRRRIVKKYSNVLDMLYQEYGLQKSRRQ